MVKRSTLILYGAPASMERAVALLENQLEIQCVSASASGEINLRLNDRLSESALVKLLAKSGISGFQIR